MKNRRASWIIAVLLVLIMTMPVLAQDDASEYRESNIAEEVIEEAAVEAADVEMIEDTGDQEEQTDINAGRSSYSEESSASEGSSSDKTSVSEVSVKDGSVNETASPAEQSRLADAADLNAEEQGSEEAECTVKTSVTKAGTLTLITVGEGTLSLDKGGNVICTANPGYEIVSITADTDSDGIKAGDQIPEDDISGINFEDGTAITAVFEREAGDDDDEPPASAAAIFG